MTNKPNPFLIACPHCSGSICTRCLDLNTRAAGLGSDVDDERQRKHVETSRNIHLMVYPHTDQVFTARPAAVPHDLIERLGLLVDKADNLHAASLLPVRPEIHVEGLRGGMSSIAKELREIVIALGGDDVWSADVAWNGEEASS